MSELKVLIGDQFAFGADTIGIAVILQHSHEERSIMRIDKAGFTHWEAIEQGVATTPTVTVSNDIGRALLDTLTRHYQGASDMHTVRSDLLHERGRVDKLIEAVIGLADNALESALGN